MNEDDLGQSGRSLSSLTLNGDIYIDSSITTFLAGSTSLADLFNELTVRGILVSLLLDYNAGIVIGDTEDDIRMEMTGMEVIIGLFAGRIYFNSRSLKTLLLQ